MNRQAFAKIIRTATITAALIGFAASGPVLDPTNSLSVAHRAAEADPWTDLGTPLTTSQQRVDTPGQVDALADLVAAGVERLRWMNGVKAASDLFSDDPAGDVRVWAYGEAS